MQIASADSLIQALRASGLFTSEQLLAVVRELAPLGDDIQVLLKHLIQRNRVTVYQLRKVIHGKAQELFIGDYVVSDKLGEGGMGKVYRARHTRLGREVALKVVRPTLLSNPITRKRYEREVATTSSLNHPNIVAVLDAGEADGKYFLAMEFVDGVDLARLVRDHKPLTVPEACEYTRQAALGLQHAHENGFVHRDIKPSNVVVSGERHVPQAGELAIVKLLDMGLVRSIGFDDGGPEGTDLTRAGTVVGTPDYMAPEQAKNSSTVDHRADIYSLGCTLYFLLAGHPPFPDGTPIEKLLKHQLDKPIPLRTIRNDVPEAVANVVERMMAKKPSDRYATAKEVAEALGPLAVYPEGTTPIPIRPLPVAPVPSAGSTHSTGRSTIPPNIPLGSSSQQSAPPLDEPPLAEPVAPSDHTPRPAGLSGTLHAANTTSPFSALDDPISGQVAAVAQESSATPAWLWVVAPLMVIAGIGLGIWAFVGVSGGKPTVPTSGSGSAPDNPTRTPPSTKSGIVPAVNLTRLQPLPSLIPDTAGFVAVAYPSVYWKEKTSPFARGAGPSRLATWATRLTDSTALSLSQSERVVLSIAATDPAQYLLASEGEYLTAKFAADLEKHPKLRPLGGPKFGRPVKVYNADNSRQTALWTPSLPAQPVYFLSGAGVFRNMPRGLLNEKYPTPSLPPGMLAALNAASESPLPLLFAVAGKTWKLPFTDGQTLQDMGIELLTARLRIGEKAELELTLTGPEEEPVRNFPGELAKLIRQEYPEKGTMIAELLDNAERKEEAVAGGTRVKLKVALKPDDWSALLEQLLAP